MAGRCSSWYGSARVERDGQAFGERGPGEVLGEIAPLDGGLRTATVTSSEPSRLLVVARRENPAASTDSRRQRDERTWLRWCPKPYERRP